MKGSISQKILQAKQEGKLDDQTRFEQQLEQEAKEIDRKFSGAIDQLVMSYDEHMKKIIPKPKLLPIRVNIVIAAKAGFKIENAHVKPYDNP